MVAYTLSNNLGKDCYYVVSTKSAEKQRRKRKKKRFLDAIVEAKLILDGRQRSFEIEDPKDVEITVLTYFDQKTFDLSGDLEIQEDGIVDLKEAANSVNEVQTLQTKLDEMSKENERLRDAVLELQKGSAETSSCNSSEAGRSGGLVDTSSCNSSVAKLVIQQKSDAAHFNEVTKWFTCSNGKNKKSGVGHSPPCEMVYTSDANALGLSRAEIGLELIKCAKLGDLARICTLLLMEYAFIDWADRTSHTALMWAAIYDQVDAVKLLVANGANPRTRLPSGDEAIHLACKWGHTRVIAALLEARVPVNTRGFEQRTPLMFASLSGKHGSVKLLLKHGADKDLLSVNQKKAIDFARSYSINRDLV